MPLKTTSTLPPGGWVYIQKGKDGKDIFKLRSMSPFKEAVGQVLAIRKNNGLDRASFEEVADDLDKATCERLGFDPSWCVSKKKSINYSPPALFKVSLQHLRESAEGVAQRLGQLRDGATVLRGWLGDGLSPVQSDLAQSRADVCTGRLNGSPCPHNKSGLKPVEAAAELIRQQAEHKNHLKLVVEGEASLHTCQVCWCFLPTKVHVPMKHILEGTPDAMIEKFRQLKPDCWIATENQKPANT